ncbi:MAG: DUF4040 domain-containing protein [Clostridia bacterium]|nr:DUF4040 domain-containing protein [Clostridia bacterium]
MEFLGIILLIFVIICAISVSLTKDLLTALVIFMSQSLAMAVIWILLESPDLGITEAAVGAGITSLLLFVTLKKIHAIDIQKASEKESRKEEAISDGENQA